MSYLICKTCDGQGQWYHGEPVRVYGGLDTEDVLVTCEDCMGDGFVRCGICGEPAVSEVEGEPFCEEHAYWYE